MDMMQLLTDLLTLSSLLTFVIGVMGGFLGATVGGGGLFMIPFLTFMGLPLQVAIASARLGDIGFAIFSAIKFGHAKQIVWEYVPRLALISFFAAIVGSLGLVSFKTEYLPILVAVLLVAALYFFLREKDAGTERRKVSKKVETRSSWLYLVVEMFTGFLGAGTGPIKYLIMVKGFGLTMTEGVATQAVPYIVLTVTSTAIFASLGYVDYTAGAALFLGSCLGGWAGAHFALQVNQVLLKKLFAVVVALAAIKLLFF